MIRLRKAAERGHARHGWLDTHYTFSFADYHDRDHMGFRSLRVMNEDRVEAGKGFDMHPHRDMEIITYVLEGALAHKDSLGTGSMIQPGELQRMSAGTGILHSEFNPSKTEPVHLYQIWLLPRQRGLPPSYEQRDFSGQMEAGQLRLVASPTGADGSLTIRQDAQLYLGRLAAGQAVSHHIEKGRAAWLQVLRGTVTLGGHDLIAGDGAALTDEDAVLLYATAPSEVLLFDLA